MKFGRTFTMTIQGETETWTVASPFTIKFTIENNCASWANHAHFQIYNLNERARRDIYMDLRNYSDYRQVKFSAGYSSQSQIPQMFQGNAYWAYSYRQGPDWITEIDCFDGGFAISNSRATLSIPKGYTTQQTLIALVSALDHVESGFVSNFFNTPATRGISKAGKTWELIDEICSSRGGTCFISQETAYLIGQNEYVPNIAGLDKISSDTGLLGSPHVQDLQVMATLLFEPRLVVGQAIELDFAQEQISGFYKVIDLHHRGVISETEGGDAVTEVMVYLVDRNAVAA